MRRLHRLAPVAMVCVLVLTGCGGSSTPAEKVPDLAGTLTVVEDAVERARYGQAREHLQELVAITEDARAAGDLDDGEADRVLAAALRLLTELPAPTAPQAPAPPPETEPQPEDDGDDADDEEKKREDEEKKREDEEKKREDEGKKQEKDEEDGGGD